MPKRLKQGAADPVGRLLRRVRSGKMPGVYAVLRPETRLSDEDIQTFCAAARQVNAGRTRASP